VVGDARTFFLPVINDSNKYARAVTPREPLLTNATNRRSGSQLIGSTKKAPLNNLFFAIAPLVAREFSLVGISYGIPAQGKFPVSEQNYHCANVRVNLHVRLAAYHSFYECKLHGSWELVDEQLASFAVLPRFPRKRLARSDKFPAALPLLFITSCILRHAIRAIESVPFDQSCD
jgi:hypothetical protein